MSQGKTTAAAFLFILVLFALARADPGKVGTSTSEKPVESAKHDCTGVHITKDSIKIISELLESLPARDAAKTIKLLTEKGDIELVIQLLRNIEPRNASKILSELAPPQLLFEVVEELASR